MSIIQHRHLTPGQLDAMNQRTMQSVLTNTLHSSSSGLCIIEGTLKVVQYVRIVGTGSCTEKPVCIGVGTGGQ